MHSNFRDYHCIVLSRVSLLYTAVILRIWPSACTKDNLSVPQGKNHRLTSKQLCHKTQLSHTLYLKISVSFNKNVCYWWAIKFWLAVKYFMALSAANPNDFVCLSRQCIFKLSSDFHLKFYTFILMVCCLVLIKHTLFWFFL